MANLAKKKPQKMSKAGAAMAALKFYGSEPECPQEKYLLEGTEKARALTWYNYNSDYKDGKKYLIEWTKKEIKTEKENMVISNHDLEELLSCIRNTNEKKIIPTVYWIARLINNGFSLPDETIEYFKHNLNILLLEGWVEDIGKEESDESKGPSIQDRMKEVLYDIIGDVEEKIDNLDFNFSLYEYLKTNDIKPAYGSKISDHYEKLEQELSEAVVGKNKDLREGYSNFSKPQLKKYHKMIAGIIEDGNKFSEVQKKIRKTAVRIKKPVPLDKKVKNIKYMKEYEQLKIASIDPKQIIGATSLWLYDTTSKRIINLISDNVTGLDVKGTTVINFSEKLSKCKRVRKPHEVIEDVLKGGKIKLRKIIGELTTKEMEVKGRINKNMIILKAIK